METLFTESNMETLKGLVKQYPNDMELGKVVRETFSDVNLNKFIPNNQDLGEEVRKKIVK